MTKSDAFLVLEEGGRLWWPPREWEIWQDGEVYKRFDGATIRVLRDHHIGAIRHELERLPLERWTDLPASAFNCSRGAAAMGG